MKQILLIAAVVLLALSQQEGPIPTMVSSSPLLISPAPPTTTPEFASNPGLGPNLGRASPGGTDLDVTPEIERTLALL